MKATTNGPVGQVRQEIESTFGFVPGYFSALPHPAMEHAWGLQRDLELPQTALDQKTKELIGLAVASHIKCRYCVYFHSKAARFFGANEDELREAIAMGGTTVMFSNSMTGMQMDYDQFTRDVDRALDYIKSHPPAATSKPSNRPRA